MLKFRRLLETHDLGRAIFDRVNGLLAERGLKLNGATMVDATIIHAASSTKNAEKSRAPLGTYARFLASDRPHAHLPDRAARPLTAVTVRRGVTFYDFLCCYVIQRLRECFRVNVGKGVSQRLHAVRLACRDGYRFDRAVGIRRRQ